MLTGDRVHRLSCPCGWSGSYTTPGYARKAHTAHSCDVDWSPKACDHGRIHTHGTRACHVHCGCKCEPCRIATADEEIAMRQRRAYGRTSMVDAAPVRAHVTRLLAAGMGEPRIAAAAGLDRSVIRRLTTGKVRRGRREFTSRLSRATAARLLAVTYDPADGGGGVDAGPTIRRLRALIALGWWPSEVARRLGMDVGQLWRLMRWDRVRPGTARRVHALYRALADTPPPDCTWARRARAQAREKGWQPPVRVGGRVVAGPALEEAA